MAIELAVCLPVLIITMVVALDCMVYMGQCARFDALAAQNVMALAVSPAHGAYSIDARKGAVQQALSQEFSTGGASVGVEVSDAGAALASMSVFTCRLKVPPWPLSHGGASVFGTGVPLCMEHEYKVVVDPYTPGELM